MNNEIRNTLLDTLAPHQRSWLEAAHHIFYGARGMGRSYLLCTLALLEAVNYPGVAFYVYYHERPGFVRDRHVFDLTNSILKKHGLSDKFEVQHNVTEKTVKVRCITESVLGDFVQTMKEQNNE